MSEDRADLKRVCILALDALEYDLVEKFDLKGIKQVEYGKVTVPPECFKESHSPHFEEPQIEPYTPKVWFSFLTGKLPTPDNFSIHRWDNEVLEMLQFLSAKLGLHRVKGKGKLLKFLGFRKRASKTHDYGVPTFFDFAEGSYDINVPVYSEEWHGWGLEGNPDDFENFTDFIAFTLDRELLQFNKLRRRTLLFLKQNRDWQLFMVYFKTLDTYGELCFADPKRLSEIYKKFDSFVTEVKKRLNECFVFIISDHGMERLGKTPFGKHSNHAFYSINKPLGLKNPKITDFYALIRKVLESD